MGAGWAAIHLTTFAAGAGFINSDSTFVSRTIIRPTLGGSRIGWRAGSRSWIPRRRRKRALIASARFPPATVSSVRAAFNKVRASSSIDRPF